MKPDKWMPMYWGDLWRDTGHLSAAARGAYYDLIGAYWVRRGPLPSDDGQLMRLARCTEREWRAVRESVLAFFAPIGNTLKHGRIDAELAKANAQYERRANAGRVGGVATAKQKPSNATSNATGIAPSNATHNLQPHTPNGVTDANASVRARGKPRGIRLPETWEPTAQDRDYAITKNNLTTAEIDGIAEQFRRYWTGPDAKNPAKRDWHRAWCNWVDRDAGNVIRRRSAGRQSHGNGPGTGGIVATFARAAARMENNLSRQRAGIAGGDDFAAGGPEICGIDTGDRRGDGADAAGGNRQFAGSTSASDEGQTGNGSGPGRHGHAVDRALEEIPGGRGAPCAENSTGRADVLAVVERVTGAPGPAQPDTSEHRPSDQKPRPEATDASQGTDQAGSTGGNHGQVPITAQPVGERVRNPDHGRGIIVDLEIPDFLRRSA